MAPRLPPNAGARTALEKRVRRELLGIADVPERDAVFGDGERTTAFFVDATQIANLVRENVLALRVTRKVIAAHRAALRADERVELGRSGGDWIGVAFPTGRDVGRVVELATLAADAHRPEDRPARLPPTGADLARRQRFH
ncbi:MAG TPA: luciferase family protein [Acidimicrobiales bacterium]|nr:luciferase family protein [Acidimicrobiales bacterium]